MTYVMGFVAAVPSKNKAAYEKHATDAVPLFRELGAGRMVEAWGDDVAKGKQTDFYRAVAAEDDEVIVYSFQEYRDKAAADSANEKMMSDPRMEEMGKTMPFDGNRMIFGGFDVVFDKRGSGTAGYIDGSILPVPADKRDAYREAYDAMGDLIIGFGAVRVVDAWGDNVPEGKITDFRRAVAAKSDEAVIFSWVEWPSKAARDEAWAKLYQDPRMQQGGGLVDEGRRVFGGFVPILDA